MSQAIKNRPFLFLIAGLAAVFTLALWTVSGLVGTPAAHADGGASTAGPPATLHRAGLSPAALCAAGVDDQSVSTLVADCFASAESIDASLAGFDEDVAEARADFIDARRRAMRGDDEADPASAATAMDDARTLRDALIASVRQEAEPHLSADESDRLDAIAASGDRAVPIEYRVIERSDSNWNELRGALLAQKVASQDGTSLDGGIQSFLTSQNSQSDVAIALAALVEDADDVESAWTAAAQ